MITGDQLLGTTLQEMGPVWRDRVAERLTHDALYLCPYIPNVFRAFTEVGPRPVEVIILGQDPYHTRGKANGLAFGYHRDYMGEVDSSLANIFQEVQRDVGVSPQDTTLQSWAKQGVLLVNVRLTTVVDTPLAHAEIGWEDFTRFTMTLLGQSPHPKVFLLWGAEAGKYASYIDEETHLVLTTSHPCRYGVGRGCRGCGHFSAVNEFRDGHNQLPIQWGKDAQDGE